MTLPIHFARMCNGLRIFSGTLPRLFWQSTRQANSDEEIAQLFVAFGRKRSHFSCGCCNARLHIPEKFTLTPDSTSMPSSSSGRNSSGVTPRRELLPQGLYRSVSTSQTWGLTRMPQETPAVRNNGVTGTMGSDSNDIIQHSIESDPIDSLIMTPLIWRSPARYLWSILLVRLYESTSLVCPICMADMRIIALTYRDVLMSREAGSWERP